MLIVCHECVSTYSVDAATAAQSGGMLCCAHCRKSLPPDMPSADRKERAQPRSAEEGASWKVFPVTIGCLAMASALLFWRAPIQRSFPIAAVVYAAIGAADPTKPLVVEDLKTALTPDGLTVEGRIANPGPLKTVTPPIRIRVRDAAAETLFTWTAPPPKSSLGPGEAVGFTSHLDQPPPQGRTLVVDFATGRTTSSDGS